MGIVITIKKGDVFTKKFEYDSEIGMVIASIKEDKAKIRIYNNIDDDWAIKTFTIITIQEVLEEDWKHVGNYEKTARLC